MRLEDLMTTLRAVTQTYVTAAEFFSFTGSENQVIYIAHWRLTTAHSAVAGTAIKCFAPGKVAGATRRLTGSLWQIVLGIGALIGGPKYLKREID
jgi:gentisate 1,2-dioxygenase